MSKINVQNANKNFTEPKVASVSVACFVQPTIKKPKDIKFTKIWNREQKNPHI